jgi:acyl-CoA dehydrogenase
MQPPCPNKYPTVSSEHEPLRNQIRRFVEQRVKPQADQWEDLGYVPREVLREMGELGFLEIRYPAKYGVMNSTHLQRSCWPRSSVALLTAALQ